MESYFVDVNEEYVLLAIQYLKIQLQNPPNFDARLTYRKEQRKSRKNLKRKKESVEYVNKLKLKKKNVEYVSKQESKKKNLENIKQQNILTFREIESVKKFVSILQTIMCHVTNSTKLKVLTNISMVCITCDKHL